MLFYFAYLAFSAVLRRSSGVGAASSHDPGDRQRIPARLEHHLIVRAEALREQPELVGSRLDPPSTAHLTALCDGDLAEVAVHVERDETHHYLLLLGGQRRRGGQNVNYGSVLAAHPGSRRGGQLQTTGSQPIVSTACPTHVLPEAPVPETGDDANSSSGRGVHGAIFMPLQHRAAAPRA